MKLQKLLLAIAIGLIANITNADWQPYMGIGVSGQNDNFKTTVNNPPLLTQIYSGDLYTASAPFNFNASNNMAMPTVQLGIGNKFNNNVYLGFEANASYNNTSLTSNTIDETAYNSLTSDGTFSNQVSTKLSWQSSLVAKLGYCLTQNFMPFAEAGVSIARADSTYNFNRIPDYGSPTSGPVFSSQDNTWLWGPTIGIGGDYKITQNLHLFGKADYSVLSGSGTPGVNTTAFAQSAGFAPFFTTPFKQDYRLTTWSTELGMNYYF